VSRHKVDQTVEVAVEAVTGLLITGVVERIAPQAAIRNNIKGFAARILLKNVDARVRPGMTANIKIPVASADNVMAVPLAAVFTEKKPESTEYERFVYVQQDGEMEKRNVKVGVSDYFFVEIQEGLAAGEVVALELPKEEREKKKQQLAGPRPGSGGQGGGGGKKSAANPPDGNTATASTAPAGDSAPDAKSKGKAPKNRPGGNGAAR